MIQVQDDSDYREFLKDFHNYKKQTVSGWSYRLFASRSGLSSPNYLQLVMQAKRNLSEEKAGKVAQAMSLGRLEADYFLAMVRESNARSPEEELQAHKDLLRSLRKLNTTQIKSSQSEILDKWYYMTVRELVNLNDFRFEPTWVSEKMFGMISGLEADEALSFLKAAGWIRQRAKGEWTTSEPIVDTGEEGFHQELVNRYHSDTLKYFSDIVHKVPADQRELGLLTISMSSKKIAEFKSKIRSFQDEIIGWLSDETEADEVVQFGTYLLPSGKASQK